MARRSLLVSTLMALATPGRAAALLVVTAPLLWAQARFSADPMALPLGIAMCLVFLALAPVSWRALFPLEAAEPGRPWQRPLGRVAVYAVAGAGTVLTVGAVIPRFVGIGPTFLTHEASLAVCVALFWVGGYGLGHHIELEQGLQRLRAEADGLARQAEHAQLLALRSHLDPHFLFNTLNAIAEWCRTDGETAERATLHLSAMLREILAASKIPMWPLRRELDLVDSVLHLHRIRDPEAFAVTRRVAEQLPAMDVPPLVLLPLVENAMKHGPAAGHRGPVTLDVGIDDAGAVRFELENPGGFAGPRPGGEGLAMVDKRLQHAYGDAASFSIDSVGSAADPGRTRAVVRFPVTAQPVRAVPFGDGLSTCEVSA